MAKHRKRTHQSRFPKTFLARGTQRRGHDDHTTNLWVSPNTRQKLKREIDREIRSYE